MRCLRCGSTELNDLTLRGHKLFSCPRCKDIINTCHAHGPFSSEQSQRRFGHGSVCPQCAIEESEKAEKTALIESCEDI
jgi:hypothetical protein